MQMAEDQVEEDSEAPAAPRRRRWARWLALFALLVILALLAIWLLRKDIADDVISTELTRLGLPATYEVHRIGQGGQVLRNLVIGDPKRPDLTVEEVRVAIEPRWGMPGLGRITLVKPRLLWQLPGRQAQFRQPRPDPVHRQQGALPPARSRRGDRRRTRAAR